MGRLVLNASELLDDMRYVHEVLDEAGHLGLSDGSADRIRAVVQRRITELEAEVSSQTKQKNLIHEQTAIETRAR